MREKPEGHKVNPTQYVQFLAKLAGGGKYMTKQPNTYHDQLKHRQGHIAFGQASQKE